MREILDQVDTIVLVMMENRSFDHMLGHLSLINPASKVDGLHEPLKQYDNDFKGTAYPCYARTNDDKMGNDVPHEYGDVDVQLKKDPVTSDYTMKGFVEAFAAAIRKKPNPLADPMGYFTTPLTFMTDFLATNFCVCDRWFASLPTSTQPNRTMAFSGDSSIAETTLQTIDINNDIFTWMDNQGIRWTNYHDAISFFMFYPKLWTKYVFSDRFKRRQSLAADMQKAPSSDDAQVIIIEPSYYSARNPLSSHPNDNHAPLSIGWGENFLRQVYNDLTSNAERWAKTVMIVYYDEHGGFFDHVPPPKIPYNTKSITPHPFESLGLRVPGLVVSPFVKPGTVCSELFDHTSVLQFIAERFAKDKTYSTTVTARKNQKIQSISIALNNTDPYPAPHAPKDIISLQAFLGDELPDEPESAMDQAFANAADEIIKEHPEEVRRKYPELYQWRVKKALR